MTYYGSDPHHADVSNKPEDSGFVDRNRGGAESVAVVTGTSGAVTIDCALGSIFTLTPTAAVTSLTILNPPRAGKGCFLTLIVSQGATAYAIADPAGTVKRLGTAPTQTINKDTVYSFLTVDGGLTWYSSGQVSA